MKSKQTLNPFFLTQRYVNATVPRCASMAAIASATGIDKTLLRLAKKRGLPGFNAAGNITWRKFKPAFEARFDELTEALKSDTLGLRDELLRRDIKIKDLQILRLEGRMLEPNDVKQLLVELTASASAVFKREFAELPPRLAGKSEVECKIELEKSQARIFATLKSGESKLAKLNEQNK